jgi:hypothetical protein
MARRAGLVAGIVGLVVSTTAGVASATTITQPNTNPFHAPGDVLGNPVAFTVSASGFTPGENVYLEQCDGKPESAPDWQVDQDCDLGSSPAAVSADGSGNVTWDANSPQPTKRFKPFKGESPQSFFNCIGPNDPPTNNGLVDYTNCQIRVSRNNSDSGSGTGEVYLPIVLDAVAKPHCDVNGSVKIAPGVTSTASVKAVKLIYKGTMTNCVGFGGFTGAKLPITGGTFTMTIGGQNPGSTCSNLFTSFGLKPSAKVSFKMTGLKLGKPAAATGGTALAIPTVTEQHGPLGDTATAAMVNNVKNIFNGLTPKFTFKYDETQTQIDALCATPKKGMGLLHYGNITDKIGAFTPVNGTSLFELD